MATHSGILAWRIPMDRGAWRATVHGVTKSRTQLSDSAQHRVYIEVSLTSEHMGFMQVVFLQPSCLQWQLL